MWYRPMTPVVFPSACGARPVRFSTETRLYAFEVRNCKYDPDTRKSAWPHQSTTGKASMSAPAGTV